MNRKINLIITIMAVLLTAMLVGCGNTAAPASQPGSIAVVSSEPPPSSSSKAPEASSVPVPSSEPESVSDEENEEITPIEFNDTIVTEKWEVSIQSTEFEDISMIDGFEDEVELDVWLTVKNLQKEYDNPFDNWSDDSIEIEVDYNDGYTYRGSASDERYSFGGGTVYLEPLETNSSICYSFFCPKEVAENTDAPLFLSVSVEGVKYQLTMR